MFKRFKRQAEPTPAKDIIFKLEFHHTQENVDGGLVDMYLLYWNSKTEEMITLGIPHGRSDIAQLIQERING